MLKPIPPNVVVLEKETLVMWKALIKGTPESSLGPARLWGHREHGCQKLGSGPSADSGSTSTLILGFLVSNSMRNKFLLFINHVICDILLQQSKQIDNLYSFYNSEVTDMISIDLLLKNSHCTSDYTMYTMVYHCTGLYQQNSIFLERKNTLIILMWWRSY